MLHPKVSIIILNWNNWKDTIECLESINQIDYSNYNLVIVDNNSNDESITRIMDFSHGYLDVKSKFFDYKPRENFINIQEYTREESLKTKEPPFKDLKFDKEIILIKNEINYGFAEGNNIGIRYALRIFNPDYILLLNNDTIVDKKFLGEMVNTGENDENIGIVGPKIYYYDEPETIWCIGGKISWKLARGIHIGTNEIDNEQYEEEKEFDYVSGSAFLIKKEVLEEVGLMDKNFFLYFEETDLSLRASIKGYKSVYSPKAKVWHKVSQSGGGISGEVGLYYITRNRWLFMKKWAGTADFIFFVMFQIACAFIFPFFLSISYKNRRLFKVYYKGLWDVLILKK